LLSAGLLILDMQESEQRLRNIVDLRVQRIGIAISFVWFVTFVLSFIFRCLVELDRAGLWLGSRSQGQSFTDCYGFSDILQVVTGFRMLFRCVSKEDVVCCHRYFGRLVVNKGPENKGHVAAFTAKYEIEQVQVSAYHALANRMIEQGHKPITDALAKLMDSGLGN
jgi:hypothetical protein